MELDTLVKQLEEELELDPLIPGEKGGYALPLDEMLIEIVPSSQGFSLACQFSAFPSDNKEKFAAHALHGNLFGQGTHGAIIGTSEDTNQLTLSKTVDYTVNYKEFRDFLEDFINAIDFWKKESLKEMNQK